MARIEEFASLASLVTAAAVFVVVLIVCLRVLPEMGFRESSRRILAICVALLSAIAVVQFLPSPSTGPAESPQTNPLEFILLPYAALGITLLLLLLLFILQALGVLPRRDGKGEERHALNDESPQARDRVTKRGNDKL